MTSNLDPREILKTLGVTQPTTITPVQGGMDTSIWRVEHDGQISALRVFRAEQINTFRREQAAMGLAEAAGIAVPQIKAAGFWQDRPALLLTWCAGKTLADQLKAQLWRIWALGVAFGRQQAAIHMVKVPPQSQMETSHWIEWAGPDEPALQERLREISPAAASLLHLDYHPLNLLVQGQRITAVLDWANARPGDPRADFARTYTILKVEPWGPYEPSAPLRLVRWLLEKSWRYGYRQVAGPAVNSVRAMAPFYAWAGAVMVRDLAPRVGKTGSWFQQHHLEAIQQWAEQWKQKAGIK